MYMNNHAYAVVAVELKRACVVDMHTGKYMTDAVYSDVEATYTSGFVMRRTDGTYDIFDGNCKTIVDKVNWQDACGPNLIEVHKNNKFNVVNVETGKIIMPVWIPSNVHHYIVTRNDSIGSFHHTKPGIYVTKQDLDDNGNLVTMKQIYIDFDGNVDIAEDNPFEED